MLFFKQPTLLKNADTYLGMGYNSNQDWKTTVIQTLSGLIVVSRKAEFHDVIKQRIAIQHSIGLNGRVSFNITARVEPGL